MPMFADTMYRLRKITEHTHTQWHPKARDPGRHYNNIVSKLFRERHVGVSSLNKFLPSRWHVSDEVTSLFAFSLNNNFPFVKSRSTCVIYSKLERSNKIMLASSFSLFELESLKKWSVDKTHLIELRRT